MKQTWKVGELAKLTGLTVRTLRFYDGIGLFSPSSLSDSGHRLYNEADIARLHQILALKELNLSLDEVRDVLTGGEFSPADIVAQQTSRVKETIRVQQKLLGELEHVSSLMASKESLSVNDFIGLLQTMKKSHEKHFFERKKSMENNLDRLGRFLSEQEDDSNEGG
ncbi:MerR family transcriptional regulator [Paenibacillus sacheonensis]|uniref:MerR family transcriptional regulator n=1 Tax=Paenibacillus sacheonensis TaxID=742054 RepID=A0A7X4YJS8_9BACL|nr:MerR family transcriptional regulator [Paenibacillus sacheonensis]MBM7563968.1 DNA-binding transcriptional MerR regulator [Paenibacillus sacheonensis]NBC67691.1 MerR family transcriptional regulator [Paenibacillus sacheonensis]